MDYDPSGNNAFSVNIEGDGEVHEIEIQDIEDSNCTISQFIQIPDCGPPLPCTLDLNVTLQTGCNSGDSVSYLLNLISEGTSSQFNLLVDGNIHTGSPYSYESVGTTDLTIWLPGDGQQATFTVQDVDSLNCNAEFQVQTPSCGTLCEILNLSVNDCKRQ